MGLLDYLFDPGTYSQGGLLSRLQPGLGDLPQSQGFPGDRPSPLDGAEWPYGPNGAPSAAPPASFADRFSAMPGAPQPPAFADRFNALPNANAPAMATPMTIGSGYQMPRLGSEAQYASTPQNAQPAQGQMLMQAPQAQPQMQPQQDQQALPTFLSNQGGVGAGLRGFANNLQAGPLGALVGGIGSAFGMQDPAQQNLAAQHGAIYRALVANGDSPQVAFNKAMVAVQSPEAAKTILPELFTNKEKFQQTGEDAFGNKQYGFVNEREQTINGRSVGQGGGASESSGFLAPGVKNIDSTLTGQDYLKQFSPEVQAAVQNYVDGKSMPTGNPRKGFTQAVKQIAQKYGADTGQSVDDATYSARRTMRNQLSSSAPASLGGQINIGNTAAGHLADLTQRALELGNVDTGIAPLTSAVNNVRGLGTEQAAKMEALKGAAQHYGQEITKFYAGSPGGVAERDRFIESVNGARSPKELAAILATEAELMRSRLDALGGQIKGVLGEEGAKQYPVLRPDGETALRKVEENVSKLKGGQSAASSGGIQEGATATNPKTGQTLTFRSGKWQ
jgi:hypothetical protein